MAVVEILEVERTPHDPQLLWGAGVDLPVAGTAQSHFGLVVAGWVLHRDTDIVDIELSCDQVVIARWRTDQPRPDVAAAFDDAPATPVSGFMGVISTLALPPVFALRIEAISGAQRLQLGVIRGRRSMLEPGVSTDPQPILVTTLGRTGSTLLMHLLAQHPAVAVHGPFPYENRVVSYWAAVCAGLSAPSSYLQGLVAADNRRFWWTGYAAFAAETFVDQDEGARWMGGAALEELGRLARRQIAGFYAVSAQAQAQGRAGGLRRFAEKRLPDRRLQIVLSELFPGGRELHLVRDFRDMVASISAFNHRRGEHGFGSALGAGKEHVDSLARDARKLLNSWRLAGDRGMLVRYEDLVREPRVTLRRVLTELTLDASDGVVDGILRRADQVAVAAQQAHRTSPDAGASIGRWRRDLSREIAGQCGQAFGEVLTEFGYKI